MKKCSSSASKHHPYLSSSGSVQSLNDKVKEGKTSSKSVSEVAESCVIPRSLSVQEESSSNWKLSFCGVLLSENEDDKPDDYTSLTPSNYQIPSANSTECSSPPIPVPIRKESRKRKSNFRSSGGYFFDKYMKRFQAKYAPHSSLGHSETIDELKVSQFNKEHKNEERVFKMRSNREDLVCCPSSTLDVRYEESSFGSMDSFSDDDLYPLRFGTSSQWASNLPSGSWNTITDLENSGSFAEEDVSSVFPTSPPCFWGDASSNYNWSNTYAALASPVPSITDAGEVACRYSDSNSETLKAMETLYLCNFRVAVDGDWLCLKEINEESMPSTSLLAATLSGWSPTF